MDFLHLLLSNSLSSSSSVGTIRATSSEGEGTRGVGVASRQQEAGVAEGGVGGLEVAVAGNREE